MEKKVCLKTNKECLGSCNGTCYIESRGTSLAGYLSWILSERSGALSRLKDLRPEEQDKISASIKQLVLQKLIEENSFPGRDGNS